MSSKEITEWMAYNNLEPFGEERADVRSAMIACVMANAFSKKKHKIEDFILKFKRRKKGKTKRMDWQVMKKICQIFSKKVEK